jgi:sulfide:quinone oxidoreductase
MKEHYRVLIVGGGSAGITTAAHLRNQSPSLEIAIIEPSDKHYYQPLWTLVGAGVFPREETERNEADFIPPGVTWIQDAVETFAPEDNKLTTRDGKTIGYDYMIVATGIQLNWDAIPGLKESIGKNGVCSNYSYDTVESTWENIKGLKKGTAIFTQPATPIKCGGAPQKICYLAEDHFRKSGVRNDVRVIFASAKPGIFPVAKYAATLNQVIARKELETKFEHNLVELRPDKKEAVFQVGATDEKVTLSYDMIHVTPPMGALDFIKASSLGNADGWVEVDPKTLQHVRHSNIFSLGDCSSLPTSKTGAAIRKQAPVAAKNLLSLMDDKAMTAEYDGYTSCPLVTGYGSLVLAEFDYDKQPQETFPFNQAEERYSMYALKAYGLPRIYWHGMLRGRA